MLSTLSPERRNVLAQLVRFVISGATVTALGVGVYAVVALVLRWHPQVGNILAYLVAMGTGYVMHSQWSFRGHGAERTHATKVRFVIVSIISGGSRSAVSRRRSWGPAGTNPQELALGCTECGATRAPWTDRSRRISAGRE